MELTASETHDMVSQWPEGARAEGLRCDDNLVDDEGGLGYWYMPGYGSNLRTNREAADLHALAGLRWMAKYNYEAVIAPRGTTPSSDDRGWSVLTDKAYDGPTLLHAVHAAVLAVKG